MPARSDETAKLLSAHGIKPTRQRIAVYRYMQTHFTHPTAAEVYAALSAENPSFSMTTVYNALHKLAEAGLIRTINIDPSRQRFDGHAYEHGHFMCEKCGALFDVPVSERSLSEWMPDGFSTQHCDIYLSGVCPACSQSK